jgi:hypothetical protein
LSSGQWSAWSHSQVMISRRQSKKESTQRCCRLPSVSWISRKRSLLRRSPRKSKCRSLNNPKRSPSRMESLPRRPSRSLSSGQWSAWSHSQVMISRRQSKKESTQRCCRLPSVSWTCYPIFLKTSLSLFIMFLLLFHLWIINYLMTLHSIPSFSPLHPSQPFLNNPYS